MSGPRARPGILKIAPYVPGSAPTGGDQAVKLSSNESALGSSPRAVAAFAAAAGDLHHYPDGAATALRAAIGACHGIDPARVICGDGSDELLLLICLAFAGPGDEVVTNEHGFTVYQIAARTAGATPVWAAQPDLACDVDAFLEALTPRTRVVFLANPDNPSGGYLSTTEITRLHAGLPGDVLLVLDAAYGEYVGAADYEPGLALARDRENVLMTRTFSKIYGLAGLRLGWAYGAADVIDVLNRIRGPFNISTAAQAAGLAALGDREFLDAARAHNDRWREWLIEALRGLGLKVAPSVTNFVLIRFPDPETAAAAVGFLADRGYLLRRMEAYGLPDCLRLTVGREVDNLAVAEIFAEFLKS